MWIGSDSCRPQAQASGRGLLPRRAQDALSLSSAEARPSAGCRRRPSSRARRRLRRSGRCRLARAAAPPASATARRRAAPPAAPSPARTSAPPDCVALRQRRVGRAVGDVRAVAAGQQLQRRAVAASARAASSSAPTAGGATASARAAARAPHRSEMLNTSSSDSSDRNSSPCFTYGPKRPKFVEIGSLSSGCTPDDARQRQQPQRLVQRDRRLGHAGLQRRALRLLAPSCPPGVSPSCTYAP